MFELNALGRLLPVTGSRHDIARQARVAEVVCLATPTRIPGRQVMSLSGENSSSTSHTYTHPS